MIISQAILLSHFQPADVPETEHLTDRDQRTIAAFGGDDLAQHAGNARVAFDVNFATGGMCRTSSGVVTVVRELFCIFDFSYMGV